MANNAKHLGLDFFVEDEETVGAFCMKIAQDGTGIPGYYGIPYMNLHIGSAQFIVRMAYNNRENVFNIVGLDTHCSGSCIWDVCVTGANIARKDAGMLERRCLVTNKHGDEGLAVVNIVNADVLPSFDEGAELKLQMIAFPEELHYFKDEEDYVAAQPEGENGEKWLLEDGVIMPTGLMHNRDPENEDFDTDDDLDDLMLIRGTVKGLYPGVVKFDDEEEPAFIKCIIGTQFGDLEIVHTIEDVIEEQHDNICVGATVVGIFSLSGDAAIYEYENGTVLDEANDLAILRSVFAGEDPERLRFVFAESASYLAEYSGREYSGRDAIVQRLKEVAKLCEDERFARLATITSVDDGDEPLPYGAGKRCVVISYGKEDNYESIAFADIDEEGRISKLTTTANSRYRFRVEEKPVYDKPSNDESLPEYE